MCKLVREIIAYQDAQDPDVKTRDDLCEGESVICISLPPEAHIIFDFIVSVFQARVAPATLTALTSTKAASVIATLMVANDKFKPASIVSMHATLEKLHAGGNELLATLIECMDDRVDIWSELTPVLATLNYKSTDLADSRVKTEVVIPVWFASVVFRYAAAWRARLAAVVFVDPPRALGAEDSDTSTAEKSPDGADLDACMNVLETSMADLNSALNVFEVHAKTEASDKVSKAVVAQIMKVITGVLTVASQLSVNVASRSSSQSMVYLQNLEESIPDPKDSDGNEEKTGTTLNAMLGNLSNALTDVLKSSDGKVNTCVSERYLKCTEEPPTQRLASSYKKLHDTLAHNVQMQERALQMAKRHAGGP